MVVQSSSTLPTFPHYENLKVSVPIKGVCHCALSRPPVNALNTALWTDLLNLLTYIEDDLFPNHIRCLIFSSAVKSAVFSAGADLTELYPPATNESRFIKFWSILHDFLTRLYQSPLYTIAAIRGATPAGGCVIALCCDERFALNDLSMGLNESAIGLVVPRYWAYLFLQTANTHSVAEKLLASGNMIDADQAQYLGLVDHVIEGTRNDLIESVLQCAQKWAKNSAVQGRVAVKRFLRQEFAQKWKDYGPTETQEGWQHLQTPHAQKTLKAILRRLSKASDSKL